MIDPPSTIIFLAGSKSRVKILNRGLLKTERPRFKFRVFVMNATKAKAASFDFSVVEKCPTGIGGLDEITLGGLPKGRPTLLCGSAGCGKTLFAMTFLYNGAVDYDEPGVFIAFEERPQELIKNVGSLRFDLQTLIDQKRLAIDYVHIDPSQIDEAGDYDLEGLFLRLGYAIDFSWRQARRH